MKPSAMMPKYFQIKEILINRLASLKDCKGGRLCTQGELIEEFGVSSITVRRALYELEAEGYLRTVNGRGVYLAARAGHERPGAALSKTWVVGLLLRDRFKDLTTSAFYGPVLDGFAGVLERAGYRPIVESVAHQAVGDLSLPASMEAVPVDGVALLRAQRNDFLLRLMERRVPLVLVDFATDELNLDAVVLDNRGGARAAVAHLAALGHRRIAHLAGYFETPELRSRSALDRLEGYREGLASGGLDANPGWVVSGRTPGERAAALERLWAGTERPTALFCFSDAWAREACACAAGLGLRVPDDLSILGFGGREEAHASHTLSLTTLRTDPGRLGSEAARLLVERMNGLAAPARRVTLPVTLVAGGSTARPRREHGGR